MEDKRIKFIRYRINLAGDCLIDLEDILEVLKQEGYIIEEKKDNRNDTRKESL
jgi:hypothetical protein